MIWYIFKAEVCQMAPIHRLKAAQVENVSVPGQYSDGNGLVLKVEPSGTKHWYQRYTFAGKRRNIGLGSFNHVSLAQARAQVVEHRTLIGQGLDPLEERRRAKEERCRPSCPTFAEAAEAAFKERESNWTNEKHASQWRNTLATYAFPTIGSKKVDEITSADIRKILSPIWTSKAETANRVRQRMEVVLDQVIADDWRKDNPAGKHILRALPKAGDTRTNHPALDYSKVAEAMLEVKRSTASAATRLSFQFLVLTAARSGEVRMARWTEVDRKKRTWTVPAERMKGRKRHRVPLSDQALEILDEAGQLDSQGGDLIFPSGRRGAPLSDMTFTSMLRRLCIPAVAHGFRSSFRDWVAEQTEASDDVGEAALAHSLGSNSKRAYKRSDLLEKRRPMMQAWADIFQ